MKPALFLVISAFVTFSTTSCVDCSTIDEPTLEGYDDYYVEIDALEDDTLILKAVTEEGFSTVWELPDGTIEKGETLTLGPVTESMDGKYRLGAETKRCLQQSDFRINYIDLSPECDLEFEVLKAKNEEDEVTFTVESVSSNVGREMVTYTVYFVGGHTMVARFGKIPEPGRYSFTGGIFPDGFEDRSLGMYFDFGLLLEYKIPLQRGTYAYIKRENGHLKMAFCDVRSYNDYNEEWRNMSMEIYLD